DRASLAKLVQIKHGRLTQPLLFGAVSLAQGYSFIRRREANYLMAVDHDQRPVGAIGYQFDAHDGVLKAIELIAEGTDLPGRLCRTLIQKADQLGAKIIEVNLSAYDARIQQTFFNFGFRPVAYAPSMVFHMTERLDVVKMIKLNIPYELPQLKLTD